jgi:hypothetical protein
LNLIIVHKEIQFWREHNSIAFRFSRTGCLPFDKRNRRHAWDFPTVKSDSFRLGSILDRKRGFEKLDQEASDEEPNVTTNMLSSNTQFA